MSDYSHSNQTSLLGQGEEGWYRFSGSTESSSGSYHSSYHSLSYGYGGGRASVVSQATAAVPRHMSSNFSSNSSYDSNRMPAAYSVSTNPPRHFTLQPGEAANMAAQANRNIRTNQYLPCEFRSISGCSEEFRIDDITGLILHVDRDHMKWEHPRCYACWFCDDFSFDSEHPDVGDRGRNFENRMHHIAGHFADGQTANGMRHDYFLLDDLHERNMIGEHQYQQAINCHELQTLPNLHPLGWRPPVPERSLLLPHDIEREERTRNRNNRHRRDPKHKRK